MGHSNEKIYGPVNSDDVNAVIPVGSHNWTAMCRSEKINRAALFRPRYADDPGLYLQAADGKFSPAANSMIAGAISQKPASGLWGCPNLGIWVPEFDLRNITPAGYGSMQSIAERTWHVPEPEGRSFDIIDHFIGYDHNAKFRDPLIQANVSKKNTTTNTIQIQLSTPSPAAQPGTISVGNMFGGRGWYFGAVVFRGTNAEGITPSDTMILFGSGTAINGNEATTVTITDEDTPPGSTETYYYRIIPFVCDRANVTSAADTTFYSIRMSDEYPGMYTLKAGDSATGGGVRDYILLWADVASSRRYPMPNDTEVSITPSTYHPDVAVTFRARPEGKGAGPLKDQYSRVEMTFSRYVGGVPEQTTYTWRRNGASPDDNVLKRDTQKDNVGGFEDYLFFTIDSASFLQNMLDLSEIEMTADFYYNDGTADYGLWGTFIPEDSL